MDAQKTVIHEGLLGQSWSEEGENIQTPNGFLIQAHDQIMIMLKYKTDSTKGTNPPHAERNVYSLSPCTSSSFINSAAVYCVTVQPAALTEADLQVFEFQAVALIELY